MTEAKNLLKVLFEVLFAAGFVLAGTLFLLVTFPGDFAAVNSQTAWGPVNNQASLNGERLTYYPAPTVQKCQSDCSGNPNCKGFTLIRAGTYNPNDPAMCYLMSSVTSVVAANCCISAVKTSGGGDTGWGPINNQASLNGTTLTYYPESTAGRCQSVCNGNPRCKGFTFIRAGAYNPQDQSMCYILSEVTGSVPSNCCISGVKGSGSGGGSLMGDWSLQCCNNELGWTLTISNQQGNTFSGYFSDNTGGGVVTNGQVNGNIIEFDRSERSAAQWKQHWRGQLVNNGGRLTIINGVWTGDYLANYPGRNNWHAEKK